MLKTVNLPALSNFNYFLPVKGLVLVVKCIAELVAYTMCGTYGFVDVTMGMAIYPIVDATATAFDIVGKFYGEGTVNLAATKLWRHQLE